jgi:hypothetical protein
MPTLQINARLRKALKKVNKPQTGWFDVFAAVTGRADGEVLTGTRGEIWVTNLLNGQPVRVHNTLAPSAANYHVEVGRRVDQPNLWQIKSIRQTFPISANGDLVAYHADQHVFPNVDTIPVDRKQVMAFTVWVSDAANFEVAVFGGVAPTKNGMVQAETDADVAYKIMDLSSYIPTTGAKFIDIVVEEDGTLSIVEGDEFQAPALATSADIPMPAHDQYIIAYVLLYESMEALSNSDIRVVMPLGTNYLLNADEFSGFLVGITSIQEAFEELDGHTHPDLIATTRWEPLANGDPSDPQLVFDATGNVIMTEVEI